MTFSLSYEQLLQETEERIKKYDLNKTGKHYAHNFIMACDLRSFWHTLAVKGYLGIPDVERIDADWARLDALIDNGSSAT